MLFLVKPYKWSLDKNRKLIAERKISFEKILQSIANGNLLDVIEHPNPKKYPKQRCLIVGIQGYCYVVPFEEKEKEIFLFTIIPSRKQTKLYLKRSE